MNSNVTFREYYPQHRLTEMYHAVSAEVIAFKWVWHLYLASGVCDTEGRCAIQNWLEAKLEGRPVKRLSFASMEGYSGYCAALHGGRTKSEIASEILVALKPLLKSMKKVLKSQNGIEAGAFVDTCF